MALPGQAAWQAFRAPPRQVERPAIESLSDEQLAAGFAAGDAACFEQLVTRYTRPVFSFVYRFVNDYDDANDVSQATFVQLYTSIDRVKLDQPLKPWLYQIARNKAIDLLRAKRHLRFSELTPDDEDQSPAELVADSGPLVDAQIEQQELEAMLNRSIAALPAKYRQVVAMRYATDLTFKEMGDALGLPENTVKTLFQRAKGQLRLMLAGER
jgi:RNA polymerase sigma-70 factor (ECF subfamily)